MARMPPGAFDGLRTKLQCVPFNCLFARSVIEEVVDGTVWCDNEREPTFAHVIHPYGMTLLLALSANVNLAALKKHVDGCRRTSAGLWMQIHPQDLAAEIDRLLDADLEPAGPAPNGVAVQRHTRSNFLFRPERYASLAPMRAASHDVELRRMTAEDFASFGVSVSPRHFWRNAAQFLAHGGGWCVARNGEAVTTAFASFRMGSQLEIGVETCAEHRGRGYAKLGASALIDQCVESGIEPVWSCRKQNVASYELALALGFSPTVEGAYYHLPRVPLQS